MEKQIVAIIDGSVSSYKALEISVPISKMWSVPIRAVFLIDPGMQSILGDEWLSNAGTRTKFFHWFGSNLNQHLRDTIQSMEDFAGNHGVAFSTEIITGKPEKVIPELGNSPETFLLVLGHPWATPPDNSTKINYRIHRVMKSIKCPVFFGPKDE